MELTLLRDKSTDKTTTGVLVRTTNGDNTAICYTLEDVVRPDGVKVAGKTAIPAGRYKISIDMSTRFKRMMIHVLDVPNYAGIRFHGGNTSVDTEGCIIVAKYKDSADRVHGSMEKFVFDMVNKAIDNEEEVWLIIKPNR